MCIQNIVNNKYTYNDKKITKNNKIIITKNNKIKNNKNNKSQPLAIEMEPILCTYCDTPTKSFLTLFCLSL